MFLPHPPLIVNLYIHSYGWKAMKVFEEIRTKNREGMVVAALPFYSGFGAAVIGCYASIPLVFDRTLVEWFNARFVTADMPPEQDLETFLEVGAA